MQSMPLENVTQRSFRELAFFYHTRENIYSNFVFSVFCMKMRWRMVTSIHGDGYPKEPAYYRHDNTPKICFCLTFEDE